MSKTRERVIALGDLLDRAIEGENHERIESLYGVFQQEREYLNVELNIEIDDLGEPEPGTDELGCVQSMGTSSTGDPYFCGEPTGDDGDLCDKHSEPVPV